MVRRLLFPLVIVLAATTLASCSTTSPDREPPLAGTEWVLAVLPGRELVPDTVLTIRFGAVELSGTDGCNRYLAPYRAVGGTLQIDPMGPSTLMACNADVEAQADLFRSALQKVRRYAVETGRLQLLGDDGDVLMVFDQQAQELAGTAWRVTGVANGRGGVVSVLGGSSLTLTFRPEGSVSGSAGCNRYRGSYRQEGRAVDFGPVAATRMHCARPEGVMEQEQRFLAALESVASMEWEAARLRLRTASGAQALQLTLEPDTMARVTGTATYRERIALPPAAILTVRLVDVSKADAPAMVVAEQRIEVGSGGVPVSFEIGYDAAAVDPRYRYALQARIEAPGELLFISDQHHGVITQGAPSHVDMVLKRVEPSR